MKVSEICRSETLNSIFSTPTLLRAVELRLEKREAAAAIKIMERMRWPATGNGCRSVKTVIPPRIPCPNIPSTCPSASERKSLRPVFITWISTARAEITNAKVSKRFPNSIQA
jgi:hypothetical protein